MAKQRNAFKVGLALLLFAVLFVGVLVFLAPRGVGDLRIKVRFPHTQLTTVLPPGSEVICGGKTVGSVETQDLVEMKDEASGTMELYSVVGIKVDSSLGLRQDCKIIPEGALLGGMGQLVILNRGSGQKVRPGESIDGQPALDFSAITRALGTQLDPKDPGSLLALIKTQLNAGDAASVTGKILSALDDITAVTQTLRNEFNPQEKAALLAKLRSILDHVNEATGLLRDEVDKSVDTAMLGKLHNTLDTLNRGLDTVVTILEENREPINNTVEHIQETSRILERQIAVRIAQQLDTSDPASLMAKVHVSIDRLGGALTDVRAITAATREVVVLNKDQFSRTIGNLKETSDHLKAASKDIRRNPWRLLYQPSPGEAAQANIFDAARAFSEAATRVDDAITRLEAFKESEKADALRDDPVLMTILGDLEQTFARFTKAETVLWDQLKIK